MKRSCILFILVGCLSPLVCAGQTVHWTATEEITFDDNIYLKDKQYGEKKSSFINSVHIAADYKRPLPQSGLHLQAGAMAGFNGYTANPSRNNYVDAAGNIALRGEKLQLADDILYTSEPADSSLTERTKRLNNTATAIYQTSHQKRISFGVGLQDLFDRYFQSDMDYLNRNRVNASAQIFYNFTPRTYLFAEYMFSDIAYKGNQVNNSLSHTAGLGLKGQLSGKLSGMAKLTYDKRRYSHVIEGADNRPDLLGYYAELTWKATARDTLRLLGERSMEETLYGANRYFVDTFVSVYAGHQLNAKWKVSLTLGWEDMHYSRVVTSEKRRDTLYTLRPQLDYAFQNWLIGSVWYQYRHRASNEYWADYVNNRMGCMIKVLF